MGTLAAGIVSEYNPFHKGHRWMIQALRKQGFGTIACVMSGSFVQRAEPALYPVHVRAKAALAGGVDLVLLLPVPYAVASAEAFAAGGVGLLAGLGCIDTLAFRAETPDVERLVEVAALLQSEGFSAAVKKELTRGISFAAARAAAMESLLPGAGAILNTPNNILAVEYCKALRQTVPQTLDTLAASGRMKADGGYKLKIPRPLALPRKGAIHDGNPEEGFASASWLRGLVQKNDAAALEPWVPQACLPLYTQAERDGEQIDAKRWEIALLARLRGKGAAGFAAAPGAGEGLETRVAQATQQAVTLEELYTLAKSKRFAHSRVRRMALSAALGLPAAQPVIPPFIKVLAANRRGMALLRQAKHSALLPVSTSLAKLGKTSPEAARLAVMEAKAEDLYAFCQCRPQPGGRAFTQPAYFEAVHKDGSTGEE